MKKKKFKIKIDTNELLVRPIDPEKDVNFLLSTWLKSYRQSDFSLQIPNEIYFPYHQSMIMQILMNPNNSVTILATPEDPDQIIGYIVYNTVDPIIFYTYIKYPFRKLGLGRFLFESIRKHYEEQKGTEDFMIQCTHKCRKWAKVSRVLDLIYNPYITGNIEKVEEEADAS